MIKQIKDICRAQDVAVFKWSAQWPVWVIILAVTLLAGCDTATQDTTVGSEQSNLDQSISLWDASKISTYQYTYKRACNCMPEQDIVVAVASGDISEAFYTPAGSYLNDDELDSLYTVENMFELIQEAIDLNVAVLEVAYNRETGYPEQIYIDINKNLADEEITHFVKDFQ